MITQENINLARFLLSTYDAVNAARIAKDRKPYVAWQRKAKPLAGFLVRERPLGGLVHKILAERVAAFDQEARASQPNALPTPPAELVIRMYLPAYQRKRAEEMDAATQDANRSASRSTVASTADALRQYEAEIRDKVKHLIAYADLDAEGRRLLAVAAHLREAAYLIDTHAMPDTPFNG